MRYFFEIAYNGKNYHGWQAQENATTVQGVIASLLETKLRCPVEIVGSGRTDTGVHALQQFFHVDTKAPLPDTFVHDFNAYLPSDIAVRTVRQVKPTAHARFDAISRSYVYQFTLLKDPFLKDQAATLHAEIDVEAMQHASQELMGKKDFEAFSKVKTDVKTFECEITRAEWEVRDDLLRFHIRANRFLRGMVRAIVGTLLEVGKGKATPGHITRVLASHDRKSAGHAVEARGLFLSEVVYPDEIFLP